MPTIIAIAKLPNQSLDIELTGLNLLLTLKASTDGLLVTMQQNDFIIIEGLRVVVNSPVLQSAYLFNQYGNMILVSDNDELPNYRNFGDSQRLLWYSPLEINALS